jgi:hypothetical protein
VTAKYLEAGEHNRVVYPLLGLAGEVGEVIAVFLEAVWGRVGLNEMNPLEHRVWLALNRVASVAKDCEALKKQLRKGSGDLLDGVTDEHKEHLRQLVSGSALPMEFLLTDETADTLWYSSQLLRDIGVRFSAAAELNLAKLAARNANSQIVERTGNRNTAASGGSNFQAAPELTQVAKVHQRGV